MSHLIASAFFMAALLGTIWLLGASFASAWARVEEMLAGATGNSTILCQSRPVRQLRDGRRGSDGRRELRRPLRVAA